MTAPLLTNRVPLAPQTTRPGVLFAGNFYSAEGGSLSVCEELSGRLADSGWPVITVSRWRDPVRKLGEMVGTAWRKRAQYRVAQIDLFSGAAFTWAEAVAWTARRAGRPFVLTLHGGNLPEFAARSPHRVRRLLRAAAAVTAPSPFLREGMRPYRDDIIELPNALSLEAYRYRTRDIASPNIVWVRALHDIYNPVLVPRVLAQLVGEVPGIKVIMVGPDKGDGSLQRTLQAAASLGVGAHLEFIGGVPKRDVPALLDRGDIFLNTANIDNAPMSVSEALASGLCVVSTAVGGIPHLLRDGVNALLVPADDEMAMAAAVRRVLVEPGLAQQLSRAARARAEAFEWSAILPQWEQLLASVAGGARG